MRLTSVSAFTGVVVTTLCVLILGGCKADKTSPCGNQTCREGFSCDTIHDECVVPAQLEVCVGEPDGSECLINGADGFVCDQEVCLQSECGDGILDVHTGEMCDDGNQINDDACPNNCSLLCGNGTTDPGEACDGDDLDSQTCASRGFDSGQLQCDPQCGFDESQCIVECGNGEVHSTEGCDDDNTTSGDGCSDNCEVETDWVCQGSPSVCALPYVTLSGGAGHICARRSDDTHWCWGLATNAQLGNGSIVNSSMPVPADSMPGIVDIAAGGWHTCALMDNATVWCWGMNNVGQLGNGTTSDLTIPNPTPVQVTGLSGVVSISAGAGHTCAIKTDDTTWCWGANGEGQLGDGLAHQVCPTIPPSDCSPIPVEVSGLTGAVTISGGAQHTCAIKSDGTVWCWGWNNQGQVGDGTTTTPRPTPVAVLGLPDAVTIDGGLGHTCAVRSDGTLWCWGWNSAGQIGIGSAAPNSPFPTQVSLVDVAAVTAGVDHTCAVQTSGAVSCWGNNQYGQLGDNTNTPSDIPVQVVGLSDADLISTLGEYTCAITTDGLAWCWGWNEYGQLGNGDFLDSAVPVPVLIP